MGEVIFTQVNDENETTTYEKEIVAILLPDFVLNCRYGRELDGTIQKHPNVSKTF